MPGFLGKGEPCWGLVSGRGIFPCAFRGKGPTHLRYLTGLYCRTFLVGNTRRGSPTVLDLFVYNNLYTFHCVYLTNNLVSASCPFAAVRYWVSQVKSLELIQTARQPRDRRIQEDDRTRIETFVCPDEVLRYAEVVFDARVHSMQEESEALVRLAWRAMPSGEQASGIPDSAELELDRIGDILDPWIFDLNASSESLARACSNCVRGDLPQWYHIRSDSKSDSEEELGFWIGDLVQLRDTIWTPDKGPVPRGSKIRVRQICRSGGHDQILVELGTCNHVVKFQSLTCTCWK